MSFKPSFEKNKITIDINEPFNINSIRKNEYDSLDQLKLDLAKIMAFAYVDASIMVLYKANTNSPKNPHQLILCEKGELNQIFSTVELEGILSVKHKGETMRLSEAVNMKSVFDYLMVEGFAFYTEQPNWYSIFGGYPIKPSKTIKQSLINPILEHWKAIMCCNDKDKYEFWLNWVAFILQNPSGITGKALLFIGEQGCGKTSFVTNIICDLIGNAYSVRNCTDANNIFGKFNSLIERKKLIVLNEVKDTEGSFGTVDYERLKATITDDEIDINPKNENQHTSQNVCNLIVCSNNARPLGLKPNDRRTVVFNFANKYANRNEDTPEEAQEKMDYFDKLGEVIENPEFYPTLMKFFMDRDIKEFNPHKPFHSSDTVEYLNNSKSEVEIVFEENILKFAGNGFNNKDLYECYTKLCAANGTKQPKKQSTLINEMKKSQNQYGLIEKKRGFTDVNTGKREYYLQFENVEAMKKWITVIEEKLTDECIKVIEHSPFSVTEAVNELFLKYPSIKSIINVDGLTRKVQKIINEK